MTSLYLFGIFGSLWVLFLLSAARFLQLGTRWTSSPTISFGRALLMMFAAATFLSFSLRLLAAADLEPAAKIMLSIPLIVAVLAIIAKLLRTTFWRGVGAYLVALIPVIGWIVLIQFAVRPYLCEAFVAPTNSMAPTLLGKHWTGICPRCGSPAYCTPFDPREASHLGTGYPMICEREMTDCDVANLSQQVEGGDRFFVNKLLTANRWDIVVFRLPEDPKIFYVKRLVGLPGEEIIIHDGAAWADGQKLVPPDEWANLHYLEKLGAPVPFECEWGTMAHPAKLGPGEYFVLGDHSSAAKDSRLFTQGAEGHPPYAVPVDHLVGVVTHIYWPLERWRKFR